MLALINDQVVRMEPILPSGEGGFSVRAAKPDTSGKGRVYVEFDGELVQAGVQFFVMEGKAEVNPNSGRYLLRSKRVVIRAIFMGRHQDVEVRQ